MISSSAQKAGEYVEWLLRTEVGMEEEQRDGEAPVPGTAAVDGQSSGHGEKETGVLSCQGFLMSMCQRDDSDDLALQPLESEGIAVLFTEREE